MFLTKPRYSTGKNFINNFAGTSEVSLDFSRQSGSRVLLVTSFPLKGNLVIKWCVWWEGVSWGVDYWLSRPTCKV